MARRPSPRADASDGDWSRDKAAVDKSKTDMTRLAAQLARRHCGGRIECAGVGEGPLEPIDRRARRFLPRFAEADPARDLSGVDAADKLAVLCQLAFGADIRTSDVDTSGIDWLTSADVARAERNGKRWRLVAHAVRGGCVSVEARALPRDHPLATVTGGGNAVIVETARSGAVVLSGARAGGEATATAVVADVYLAAAGLPHVAERGR